MSLIRRSFLVFLVPFLGSCGRLFSGRRGEDVAKHIDEGYLAKLNQDGTIAGPASYAEAGDRIGLALSFQPDSPDTLEIPVTDVNGEVMLVVEGVKAKKQEYATDRPWADGAGFEIVGDFVVPDGLESGVYLIAGRPEIFFVCGNIPEKKPDVKRISLVICTNTINAYSRTEGCSLYRKPEQKPKVSFLRPQEGVKEEEWLNVIQWIKREDPFGKDVEIHYITDFQLDDYDNFGENDVLMPVGHSEYWTREARENFDRFVAAGKNVVLASGNTMWWKVVYEGGNRSTLVCFKGDDFEEEGKDPAKGTREETTYWKLPHLEMSTISSIGGDFQHGGYGVFRRKAAKGWGGFRIVNGEHPFFKGSGLKTGSLMPFYHLREYDGCPIVGFDEKGVPVLDLDVINAETVELLGFDLGSRGRDYHTVGTMHLLRKTKESGFVFSFSAKDFCRTIDREQLPEYSESSQAIKAVLTNAVDFALQNKNPFTSFSVTPRAVKYPMQSPAPQFPEGLEEVLKS